MKTLLEWMTEKQEKVGAGNTFGLETAYDESLVQAQVADWISRLIGLCDNVPPKNRKAFTEQIVKEIKSRMLKS